MRKALAAAVGMTLVLACEPSAVSHKHPPDPGTVTSNLTHGMHVHVRPSVTNLHVFAPPAGAHLNYYGGHVIPAVKPLAVFWGPNVDPTEVSTMPGFFQTLVDSPYVDWLNEYNTTNLPDAGTGQTIGRGTYGGTYTITPANVATSLQDTDVQTELTHQIDTGVLPPPDQNSLYFVHFPPGVTINLQGSASCSAFCAYHGTFQRNGQDVYYAVMPDFGPGSPCQSVCGTYPNYMDGFTSAASHEFTEAITDAEVGLATTYGPPLAWMDPTNGEIGDICAYQLNGPLTGTNGVTYNVQGEWSNSRNACTITGAVINDFSVTVSPTSETLNPGGTATLQLTTALVTGSADTLALQVAGLPTGVAATFNQATIMTGGAASLTLTVDPTAPAVNSFFTITVLGGSATHQAFVSLVINGATDGGTPDAGGNDFNLSLSPSGQTAGAGTIANYTVSTQQISGSAESLSLAVAGLPSGLTATLSPSVISTGGSANLAITIDPTLPPGAYSFSVTAAGQTVSHIAFGELTVAAASDGGSGDGGSGPNDFSMTLSPGTQGVNAGSSASFTVSTSIDNGSPEPLSLSVSQLPAGITGSFNQPSISSGGSATLTLTVAANTLSEIDVFLVTVTGASGTHTAQGVLAINGQVPVTFQVNNAVTYTGQNVYVVGNIPALGSWNPAQAIALSSTAYPSWTGSLTLPPGTPVQFKFIKVDGSGNVVWEGGNNRTLNIPNEALEYVGDWQQ